MSFLTILDFIFKLFVCMTGFPLIFVVFIALFDAINKIDDHLSKR